MLPNDTLLKAVRERRKQTSHNYGILPADQYTKTLLDCVGSELCYRYAATKSTSFDDVMKKSARRLTYNNEDMLLEEKYAGNGSVNIDGKSIELPKNTLMVFRHVLTTPRKDRDGDILRTQGAKPDPSMLLLWQHVHTLPIGKSLAVAEHNSKKLSMVTAVVDVNDLAHDAAVMIENKMGRFSHGFRAIEFTEVKEEGGRTTGPGGFDVSSFEIMETSLVSVPSNVDAETEDILLSLVDGGKLTSDLMKDVGKGIRELKTKSSHSVNIDLKALLEEGEALEDAEEPKGEGRKGKEGCGCSTSKETDDRANKGKASDGTEDDKMKKKEVDQANADANNDMGGTLCPKCGITSGDDGKCPQCGEAIKKSFEDDKAGRVLSNTNYKKLQDAHDDLGDVYEHCSTRSGKALCSAARTKIFDVINTQKLGDEQRAPELTVKQAMGFILAEATEDERKRLLDSLQTMAVIDGKSKRTESYKAFKKKRD